MQVERSEQWTSGEALLHSVKYCIRRNCVADMLAGLELFGECPYLHCRARVALPPAELYPAPVDPDASWVSVHGAGVIAPMSEAHFVVDRTLRPRCRMVGARTPLLPVLRSR